MQKGIILLVVIFFLGVSSLAEVLPENGRHNTVLLTNSQEVPDLSDEAQLELAYTYAPVLWFYKDALSEEPFTLIEADYFIQVSHAADEHYELIEEGYSGAKILQSQYDGMQNPVYCHITVSESDGNTYVIIQYWFHYLYNYGGALALLEFNHEGEWEMIEVVLKYDDALLTGTYEAPYMVAYSRHSSGETHYWEYEGVEKEETDGFHPVAYIAYGTHAAYFEDLGWNEDLNKGVKVAHSAMNFILLGTQEWLEFSGKWGRQENSPLGPMFQESKWKTPLAWATKYLDTYQIHLEHPAHALIMNKEGERIGFVGGEFINEIENAYAVITDGDEYYHLPRGDYSMEISALEEGIDFDVIMNKSGIETHFVYEHQLTTKIVKAYYDFKSDVKDHVLQLDEDGDGTIDLTLDFKPAEYQSGYAVFFYVSIVALFLLFAVYRIQMWTHPAYFEPKMKTRADKAGYILKAVAVVFFILWVTAAVSDVLGKYDDEGVFLQCSVGIYLLSQIVPAFKQQYSKWEKVQEVSLNCGWSLIGLWILFTLLRWSQWVGTMEIGITIDIFAILGVFLLFLGYLVKSVRFVKAHWTPGVFLLLSGGISIIGWVVFRIFSLFPDYADYFLVGGILIIGVGYILEHR